MWFEDAEAQQITIFCSFLQEKSQKAKEYVGGLRIYDFYVVPVTAGL